MFTEFARAGGADTVDVLGLEVHTDHPSIRLAEGQRLTVAEAVPVVREEVGAVDRDPQWPLRVSLFDVGVLTE